ncbi:alpha-L-arabinofuranosidase C-terminal domain-containing protein [Granulicella cerasi]|uniref:non-reducing end alpha-L-arabinofuranosidase n=1 Tax=Granulicella cerasi TaxID=741063 RepID=A0ABW1ZB49_9BACT|nr:alpha-L-arabinofuranosidase C-terminal domain-containing protein [Granulicella cerasi]
MKPLNFASLALAAVTTAASAQTTVKIAIDPTQHVAAVSPALYGLMTEEINYSYDGGLYAELVNNRNFAPHWSGFEHWFVESGGNSHASMEPSTDGPSKALPRSMKLTIMDASAANQAGVMNDGYWGMGLKPSTEYKGSFYAKSSGVGDARVRLVSDVDNATLAEATVPLQDGAWKQYQFALPTKSTLVASKNNHLVITFAHPGTVQFQLVSVMTPTYKNRANGNREDLMEMMAALHPHFLRMPGGNYVEGNTIEDHYNWKQTIGPLIDRPGHQGTWHYRSSDGLGLLEFLEWCEDLHMDPLLAVFAGYTLDGKHVDHEALKPFVQDALDEIEYVTGDTNTKWGAERARDGHPQPFPLHYVEIGNEDWFDKSGSYEDRFAAFAKAIRAKYPELKLIATTPVKNTVPDVIDDHYYKSPEEFYAMLHHYDTMDRSGSKIFIGEWATRVGTPTPNMAAALGDAAFMTSMERNSDLIVMASYAPLFVNVNPGGMQWSSDLIGYDAAHAYGSPSYYAQVMFANHLGAFVARSTNDGESARVFASATVSADGKTLFLKLVNGGDKPANVELSLPHVKPGKAAVTTLSAKSRWDTNSIDAPKHLVPVDSRVNVGAEWKHTLAGNTIEVLDIPLQ